MKIDTMNKIVALALEGLQTDGGHHKQWFLEQILETLHYDVPAMQEEFGLEKGIAP